MKTMQKLLILGVICFSTTWEVAGELRGNHAKEQQVSVSTGLDFKDAIAPKGIRKAGQIDKIQKEYVERKYENYRISFNMYLMDSKNRYIEVLFLENEDGEEAHVAFDMTDVYKRLGKSSDRATREKIKELIGWHTPKKSKKC